MNLMNFFKSVKASVPYGAHNLVRALMYMNSRYNGNWGLTAHYELSKVFSCGTSVFNWIHPEYFEEINRPLEVTHDASNDPENRFAIIVALLSEENLEFSLRGLHALNPNKEYYHNLFDENMLNLYVVHTTHLEVSCNRCDDCFEAFFYDDWGHYRHPQIDERFHDMMLSHGVASGFSGNDLDPDDIVARIDGVLDNSDWQICCSHESQHLGAVGLYVKGTNLYVSNIDLFSEIDDYGNRVFNPFNRRAKGLVYSVEDYSTEKWDHTEHIVFETQVYGIWVKDWFVKTAGWQDIKQQLRRLELPLTVVPARRRD